MGAKHRGIGHAHRQLRLDTVPGNATGLLDDFHGAGIGHSSVAVKQPVQAKALEQGFDLGADAMYQHHAHTQTDQQIDILRQIVKTTLHHGFAADGEHEGFTAKGIDVRGGFTE